MEPLENKSIFETKDYLNVTLVSGVNGVGKTTTIGKISKILKNNNRKVVLGACDTFRAAAIEQLETWSQKIGVEIIKSEAKADPASVAYKTLEYAKNNSFNDVLLDTAGRLQNKKNLMDEYKKIANVLKKLDTNAPQEVILVLDSTSGQNVINQVEELLNYVAKQNLDKAARKLYYYDVLAYTENFFFDDVSNIINKYH